MAGKPKARREGNTELLGLLWVASIYSTTRKLNESRGYNTEPFPEFLQSSIPSACGWEGLKSSPITYLVFWEISPILRLSRGPKLPSWPKLRCGQKGLLINTNRDSYHSDNPKGFRNLDKDQVFSCFTILFFFSFTTILKKLSKETTWPEGDVVQSPTTFPRQLLKYLELTGYPRQHISPSCQNS